LAEVATENNFGFICVLGKLFANRDFHSGQWQIAELGQDTFAAFASIFATILTDSDEREVHVKADSNRYIDLSARAASMMRPA
jgi:hypothetical protein